MPSARRCPSCGEPVTPFAAGCAVCGADLEAHRRAQESSATARVRDRLPDLRPRWQGGDAFPIVLLALAPLVSPFLGLLLAALIGFDANRKGNELVRNVAIASAVVCVAFAVLLIPSPIYYLVY